MLAHSSLPERQVLPSQVWGRLGTDLQVRTIRLMAQLAFNLVAAQTDWATQKDKEVTYAVPPRLSKDPT